MLQITAIKKCLKSESFASRQLSEDDKVINKILSIREVKQQSRYIDTISGHKHGIFVVILKRPKNSADYYWVQAGYNNEMRFEPYFNFYVYCPKMTVKFLDPISNKVYSLPA